MIQNREKNKWYYGQNECDVKSKIFRAIYSKGKDYKNRALLHI